MVEKAAVVSMEDVKVGDRLRIVHEGTVTRLAYGNFYLNDNAYFGSIDPLPEDTIVSIEKLAPPLPTTPGSLIRVDSSERAELFLTHKGWTWYDGNVCLAPSSGYNVEILYDAGAK